MNSTPTTYTRRYDDFVEAARVFALRGGDRDEAMRWVVAQFWARFGHDEEEAAGERQRGVSWLGFYLKVPGLDEMELVCREPKAACSPIGLHGMCGRGYVDARSLVIADVRALEGNYIACDPKDLSELVVPMFDVAGKCYGVYDADSYDVGAFTEADAEGVRLVLEAVGLSRPGCDGGVRRVP